MPDKVSEYIDLQATGAQTDALLAQMEKVEAVLDRLSKIKLTLGGTSSSKDIGKAAAEAEEQMTKLGEAVEGVKVAQQAANTTAKETVDTTRKQTESNSNLNKSYSELLAAQAKNQVSLKALRAEKKQLDDQYQNGLISYETYIKTLTEIGKEENYIKVQNLDLGRSLRNLEKQFQSTEGSIDNLRAQLNLSLQAFDRLSDSEKQSAVGVKLKKNIDGLTESISKQEQATGRFQRNVGNYSKAIGVLGTALQSVNKKIEDNTRENKLSAGALQALLKEQQLLNQLLERQAAGFKTATQEERENTKALQQMAAAGLQATEAYRNLFNTTAELKDETADLKTSLKNAAPDDTAFNAAADAARGLVGVYGLAQSATAIFGKDNAALQETLVKLQAAETALQSIEAVRVLFKKENAAVQAITLGLSKLELIQTNLGTAAESKNIIVKYAAIAAQKALNAVTSLGAGPLIAIVATIGLLVIALSSMASTTDKTTKSMQQLNDELEINSKLNESSADAIKDANAKAIAELDNRFASESEIRQKTFDGLQKELAERKSFNDKNEAIDAAADATLRKFAGFKKGYLAASGQFIKGEKKLTEEEEKELEAAKNIREKHNENLEKQFELERTIEITRLEFLKANTEDQAKLIQRGLEAERIALQDRAKVQSDAAGDESKTMDERIAASERFERLQKQIARNQAEAERAQPGLKPSEVKIIEANKQAAINEAERSGQKQRLDLRKDFAKREREAQYEIAATALQTQADAAQKVSENENESLEDRLFAAYDFYRTQKELIEGDRATRIANSNLTAKEELAINKKSNADKEKALIEFQEKVKAITLANLDEGSARQIAGSNEARDKAIKALNDRFNEGKTSLAKYNKERLEIEKKYTIDSLKLELEHAKAIRDLHKAQGIDTAKDDAAIAAIELAINEITTNAKIDSLNALADLQKRVAAEAIEAFKFFALQTYDKEKEKIDKQIEALDKKKEKEIEVVEASALSEQEKADKIKRIELVAQKDKEQLEQRQRQIDLQRARFEKAFNIATIIASTASAIVKQLAATPLPAGFPFVAAIGAIGALQLARAIAAPLPKFKAGKGPENKYQGLGVWGDGGKAELRINQKTGRMEVGPATPTITHIDKDDIILPDAKAWLNTVGKGIGSPAISSNPATVNNNGELVTEIRSLKKVIKEKKELHVHGSHSAAVMLSKYGQDWFKYVKDQTNF